MSVSGLFTGGYMDDGVVGTSTIVVMPTKEIACVLASESQLTLTFPPETKPPLSMVFLSEEEFLAIMEGP